MPFEELQKYDFQAIIPVILFDYPAKPVILSELEKFIYGDDHH
jgi:hypothetical protein